MAILFITATRNPDFFASALESKLSGNYYDVGDGQWLVSFKGTAKQLSDLIGLTESEPAPQASGIILSVHDYYGCASTDIWDWLLQNRDAPSPRLDHLDALSRKFDNMTQRGLIPATEFGLSQSSSYPVRAFTK